MTLTSRLRHSRPTHSVKRLLSQVMPYRKMAGGASRLDAEYARGKWDCLWNLPEVSRFSVVAGVRHAVARVATRESIFFIFFLL